MMKPLAEIIMCICCLTVMSCAVIPSDATRDKLPEMPFPVLIAEAGQHIDSTVILGGYVVDVQIEKDRSRIVAVQSPLGLGQEPKSKDLSQGRLIILYDGFIDPEVYAKDRKITVAGKLLGSSSTETAQMPFPYVRIQMAHIHLWPVEKPVPRDPYWNGWGYPPPWHPWWGWPYPYWR